MAFFSPALLGPLQPASSSEAVSGSSCEEGRLIALLRGTDLQWGDPSDAAPALTRTIPGTGLGSSEGRPSGAASPCPAGEAGLPVDAPRAACFRTFRMMRPVGLTGAPSGLTSFPSAGDSFLSSP